MNEEAGRKVVVMVGDCGKDWAIAKVDMTRRWEG